MRILSLLGALVLVAAARPQEEVTLRWKLKKGDRLLLASESEMKTTTTTESDGGKQVENETQKESSEMAVEVKEVTAAGNLVLSIMPQAIRTENKSEKQTLGLDARRNAAGKAEVKVNLKGGVPGLDADEFREFLESFAANVLDTKMTVEVTPLGIVASSKAEGDLFKGVATDSEVLKFVRQFIENMISIDDMLASVTGEGFLQLPDPPARVKGTWDTERHFMVMGMKAAGKGRATLEGLEGAGADRAARISEKMRYTVDTSSFNEKLEKMVGTLMKQLGVEAKITCDIKAAGPMDIATENRFHLDRGCALSSEGRQVKLELGGTMTVEAGGQSGKAKMNIKVEGTARNTWKAR